MSAADRDMLGDALSALSALMGETIEVAPHDADARVRLTRRVLGECAEWERAQRLATDRVDAQRARRWDRAIEAVYRLVGHELDRAEGRLMRWP